MLKKKEPRKMLEYDRNGIKYSRKLYYGEIHNLQVSSHIVKIMKSKRITRHVTRLIERVHTFENEYPRERGLLIDRGAHGRMILK